jgi:uncharacterized protein (TIGR03067 family)
MREIALMLMLGIATPALADPAQVAGLAGTWTAAKAERDGAPAPELVGHRLVFEADRYSIAGADGKPLYAGTYRVDASADPPSIDFFGKTSEGADATWEGIYRLDGDSLTIVDDAPDPAKGRPAELAAPAGSGYVLLDFERSP